MLLNERRVNELGLDYMGLFALKHKKMTEAFSKEVFHWHYGSSPLVVAEMWYDLHLQQGEYPMCHVDLNDGHIMFVAVGLYKHSRMK
jgi:hypothetical protein